MGRDHHGDASRAHQSGASARREPHHLWWRPGDGHGPGDRSCSTPGTSRRGRGRGSTGRWPAFAATSARGCSSQSGRTGGSGYGAATRPPPTSADPAVERRPPGRRDVPAAAVDARTAAPRRSGARRAPPHHGSAWSAPRGSPRSHGCDVAPRSPCVSPGGVLTTRRRGASGAPRPPDPAALERADPLAWQKSANRFPPRTPARPASALRCPRRTPRARAPRRRAAGAGERPGRPRSAGHSEGRGARGGSGPRNGQSRRRRVTARTAPPGDRPA